LVVKIPILALIMKAIYLSEMSFDIYLQ
jgi:hypothetical protein